MDTIPKLFWKRLEKMSLEEERIFELWHRLVKWVTAYTKVKIRQKFEVPQWNISLNDSGIQVTLFWAEKCSPSINSNQGTIPNYFQPIIPFSCRNNLPKTPCNEFPSSYEVIRRSFEVIRI